MENIFIIGICCIIAAIMGGGFKAFGIELPLFNSVKRQVLLGLFGITLVSPALYSKAINKVVCDKYASNAVKQNKENLKLGCNLQGDRWQNNYENHYTWCLGVSNGNSENETNERKIAIDECSKLK